jgi:chromosome segregation ATPase
LLEVKEKKMELKENELKQREQEVNRREQEVKQREQEVKQKEQEVEQWDEELTQWDEELKQFALDAQLMMNNAHSLYNASAGKQQFLNYLGYFLYIKSDVQNRFLQIMIDKLKRQESDFVKCYSEVIGRYRDEIERSHASRAC